MESDALFIITGQTLAGILEGYEATNYAAGLNAVQVNCVGGSTVFLPYGSYQAIHVRPTQRLRDLEEAELKKVLAEQETTQEKGI